MAHPLDHRRLVLGVVQPRHVDPTVDIPGVFEPPPKDRVIRCFIVKDRITQAYCLFLQLNKQLTNAINWGKFLLAARLVTSMAYSEFIIYGDLQDVSHKREFYCGRLRSNVTHTGYTLWDCRERERRESRACCWSQSSGGLAAGSSKVADIRYKISFGKPQRLESVVHTVRCTEVPTDHDATESSGAETSGATAAEAPDVWSAKYKRSGGLLREVSQCLAKSIAAGAGQMRKKPYQFFDKILQSVAKLWSSDKALNTSLRGSGDPYIYEPPSVKSRTSRRGSLRDGAPRDRNKKIDEAKVDGAVVDVPLHLETRAYRRYKTGKRYYADFNRGDIPESGKNFQLVACNHVQKKNGKTLLQFGQSGPDVFFMDYSYPLTAFEAFGICLSKFI